MYIIRVTGKLPNGKEKTWERSPSVKTYDDAFEIAQILMGIRVRLDGITEIQATISKLGPNEPEEVVEYDNRYFKDIPLLPEPPNPFSRLQPH